MCGSMADIQSPARKKIEERNSMKIYMVSLLHRATIKNRDVSKKLSGHEVRGVNPEAGVKSTVGKICERGTF